MPYFLMQLFLYYLTTIYCIYFLYILLSYYVCTTRPISQDFAVFVEVIYVYIFINVSVIFIDIVVPNFETLLYSFTF